MNIHELKSFLHFPTHIQQARPDVTLTIRKFLSFLYPLNSTFDGFYFPSNVISQISDENRPRDLNFK